jgi:hypothetical protein
MAARARMLERAAYRLENRPSIHCRSRFEAPFDHCFADELPFFDECLTALLLV